MTVIQASSAGVRDMADGSLRITLEFDPRHAKDAYALFGTRGTPVAVAAITQEAAQEQAQKETIESDKPKGGPLAKLAGIWCTEPSFWAWANLSTIHGYTDDIVDSDDAAKFVRVVSGVDSRSELDHNPDASRIFNEKIRLPYMEWLQGKK
jgi:hypothetical protein